MSYIKNQDFFLLNTKFYIYIHYTLNDIPFYVGKGTKNKCLHTHKRSIWWNNIVKKEGYYVVIQEINLDEDECFQREFYWINHFGRKQLKQGTLVNLTDGGEGVSNRIYTKEQKEKQSEFFKKNLDYIQSFGEREKYFGKSLIGETNPNYGNKGIKNPISKAVVKLDLKGNFIAEYASVTEAQIANNAKGISRVCKGKRNQLKDFFYTFKEDYISKNYSISLSKNNRKIVLQKEILSNKIIKEYNTTMETAKDGFSPSSVARTARGERKTYKGFHWEYK